MNLERARNRVAQLYRATATVERQNDAGVWETAIASLPCSVRAQTGQPPSPQPDAMASGQQLAVWRIRSDIGTGLQIGDRLTAIVPDYAGPLVLIVGRVDRGSLTVSETAYASMEAWAAAGVELTFIRYDQATDTDTTHGPYFARRLSGSPRQAGQGEASIGSLMTVSLRIDDADANVEVGARVLEMGGREYVLRGRGYVRTLDDLEQSVVSVPAGGVPVRIRDVATVQFGPEIRRGAADFNGIGEAVGGIVVMRIGSNALDVIRAVEAQIDTLPLPPGVRLIPTYDRSGLILDSVATLRATSWR